MSLRSFLVQAYPRSWRDEYGAELAGILASKHLTPAVIFNVLASAARQHLRRDPWKACAVGLTLWTSGLLIMAQEGIVARQEFLWCSVTGQLFLFAAGAWAVLRGNAGLWKAVVASSKAAVIPVSICILVSTVHILRSLSRYWNSSVPSHIAYSLIARTIGVTVTAYILIGLAGVLLAYILRHLNIFAQERL